LKEEALFAARLLQCAELLEAAARMSVDIDHAALSAGIELLDETAVARG
jgi:hypothetical protein